MLHSRTCVVVFYFFYPANAWRLEQGKKGRIIGSERLICKERLFSCTLCKVEIKPIEWERHHNHPSDGYYNKCFCASMQQLRSHVQLIGNINLKRRKSATLIERLHKREQWAPICLLNKGAKSSRTYSLNA